MENSWIIGNLENSLATWNQYLTEIWQLVSETPQNFKGGGIWSIVVELHGAMQAIGYGLLVLFLAMSIFSGTMNLSELKRPETALKYFLRFAAAKAAVTYGLDLMTAVFSICGGIVSAVANRVGGMTAAAVTMPEEIKASIEEIGFFESIPLWLVTLIGSLFITVLSFVLILTVYSRFFRLFLYTALAPLPLSSFAGDATSWAGKAFLKSYTGVCLEGAVIVFACLIFTAFVGTGGSGIVDASASAVTQVWSYVGETIFNMLILVGLVKGSDRIIKEMMGL